MNERVENISEVEKLLKESVSSLTKAISILEDSTVKVAISKDFDCVKELIPVISELKDYETSYKCKINKNIKIMGYFKYGRRS